MQHRKAMSFNNGRLRPQVSSTKQGQEPLAAFFPQDHDLAMRDEAVPRSKNISSFRRGYSSMKQVHDVAQSFPGSNFPFSPDDGDGDDVFSNHEGTPGLEAPPPASPFSFSLPSPKQLGFRHDSFPEGRKRRGTSIGSFSTRTEAANRSYQDQLHRSSLSSATETRRTAPIADISVDDFPVSSPPSSLLPSVPLAPSPRQGFGETTKATPLASPFQGPCKSPAPLDTEPDSSTLFSSPLSVRRRHIGTNPLRNTTMTTGGGGPYRQA